MQEDTNGSNPKSTVDQDEVPARHFGAILEWDCWKNLAERAKRSSVPFLMEPKMRFVGEPGEQGTMFISDPSGNALEFKTFKDFSQVFAS